MGCAIGVKNLNKTFDGFSLKNINLEIPQGSVVGLIGENGAGKTTLIKCITGAAIPDSGYIELMGRRIGNRGSEDIGVVFDECHFPENLTGHQLSSVMEDILSNWNSERFRGMMSEYGIDLESKISTYSRGMMMKIQVAVAICHNPQVLILDEPTAGLDPAAREEFLDEIMSFMQNESHSVLISSHITSDLERIADYIAFIHKGSLLLCEEKNALLENFGIAKCSNDSEISDKDRIVSIRHSDYGLSMLVKDKDEFKRSNPGMVIDDASLDDIMIYMIRGETQ